MGRHQGTQQAAAALVAVDLLRLHRLRAGLHDPLSGLAASSIRRRRASSAGRAARICAQEMSDAARWPMPTSIAAIRTLGRRRPSPPIRELRRFAIAAGAVGLQGQLRPVPRLRRGRRRPAIRTSTTTPGSGAARSRRSTRHAAARHPLCAGPRHPLSPKCRPSAATASSTATRSRDVAQYVLSLSGQRRPIPTLRPRGAARLRATTALPATARSGEGMHEVGAPRAQRRDLALWRQRDRHRGPGQPSRATASCRPGASVSATPRSRNSRSTSTASAAANRIPTAGRGTEVADHRPPARRCRGLRLAGTACACRHRQSCERTLAPLGVDADQGRSAGVGLSTTGAALPVPAERRELPCCISPTSNASTSKPVNAAGTHRTSRSTPAREDLPQARRGAVPPAEMAGHGDHPRHLLRHAVAPLGSRPLRARSGRADRLANRRFYFFFIEIWPQEFYYVAGLLVMAGVGLFLVTSVVGRAWCGYTCPQTVWTDLFLVVERFFEGDRNARIKLDKAPWSVDKLAQARPEARHLDPHRRGDRRRLDLLLCRRADAADELRHAARRRSSPMPPSPS